MIECSCTYYVVVIQLLFQSLTFHMNSNQASNPQEILDHEKAIYFPPKKNVDQQQYLLFYDSGCSYMVLQILGNQVTTSHGICQVKLPLFSVNDAVLSGVRLNQIKRRISKTVH